MSQENTTANPKEVPASSRNDLPSAFFAALNAGDWLSAASHYEQMVGDADVNLDTRSQLANIAIIELGGIAGGLYLNNKGREFLGLLNAFADKSSREDMPTVDLQIRADGLRDKSGDRIAQTEQYFWSQVEQELTDLLNNGDISDCARLWQTVTNTGLVKPSFFAQFQELSPRVQRMLEEETSGESGPELKNLRATFGFI